MTVKDMIAHLQTMDPKTPVVTEVCHYCGDFDPQPFLVGYTTDDDVVASQLPKICWLKPLPAAKQCEPDDEGYSAGKLIYDNEVYRKDENVGEPVLIVG